MVERPGDFEDSMEDDMSRVRIEPAPCHQYFMQMYEVKNGQEFHNENQSLFMQRVLRVSE